MTAVILAMDWRNGIGKNGKIPWDIPQELQMFRQLTEGGAIIFGRKTWESIGKSLPNRNIAVLTRDQDYEPTHPAKVFYDSYDALEWAEENHYDKSEESWTNTFIAGGAEIYKLYFDLEKKCEYVNIDTIYISHIFGDYGCDTFFSFSDLGIDFTEWSKATFTRLQSEFKLEIMRKLTPREIAATS
jgi:dihydrofolate reductase